VSEPAAEPGLSVRRSLPARDYRPDLQGLRAVAVLLVVLDHVGVRLFHGGFVGVDVFFVLSGFLITGLLVGRAEETGSISLGEFYARRVRRIVPAAALTLVVTTAVASVLLNYVRARAIAVDSIWAALFGANIHFARVGTDYFAQGQPPSAVQHYWSLSIEEQFYFVWPAVLSLVLFGAIAGHRVVPRRAAPRPAPGAFYVPRRILVVVAAAGIASLVWSVYFSGVLPAAAYFSTRARVWELALGALLALSSRKLARTPDLIRPVLGWAGLIAIAVAAVVYSPATEFPGYAALLPTLGAVLVIAAGIGRVPSRLQAGRTLSLAPLRYVGDRSYTYYLWHWPVLVIASLYAGRNLEVSVNLLLACAAFALSVVTYRFFENPIRRAGWRRGFSLALAPVSLTIVVGTLLVAIVLIGPGTAPVRVSNAAAAQAAVARLQAGSRVAAVRPLASIVAAVKAAQRGARIPANLTPPVSGFEQDAYALPGGCAPETADATSSTVCRLGDTTATRTIAVIGDSHAEMWIPTVLAMAKSDGWTVVPLIKSGCFPSAWLGNGYPGTPSVTISQCHAWYRWAVQQAKALQPDVTLMAGCCGGAAGSTLVATRSGYAALAASLRSASKEVILVEDDDGIVKSPTDCLLRGGATLKTCLTTWPNTGARFYSNDALEKLARARRFGFMNTRGWFCAGLRCPMVVGHTVVYRDTGHITQAYALRLAVPFRAAFRRCLFDTCN
jgi:peptidoglycan/LPS O-acetylase OafA/YrhL